MRSAMAAKTAPAALSGAATERGLPASLAALTVGLEGDLAEQGHAEVGGQGLAAARAEQGVRLAVVAGERAHVLDDAEHLEVGAAGHVGHPHGHLLGGQGRRGDDQHLGAGQEPAERHLDVARAGGHVEQQVVHRSPQATLTRNSSSALASIRPRHMMAMSSSSTRKPMLTTLIRPAPTGDLVGTDQALVVAAPAGR